MKYLIRIKLAFEELFPRGIDLGIVWFAGSVPAMIISWSNHQSIFLMFLHCLSSWIYILYHILLGGV